MQTKLVQLSAIPRPDKVQAPPRRDYKPLNYSLDEDHQRIKTGEHIYSQSPNRGLLKQTICGLPGKLINMDSTIYRCPWCNSRPNKLIDGE